MGSAASPGGPPLSRLVRAVLLLAALFAYARLWGRCADGVGLDFYQFWVVGRAARLQPGIDPYSEEGRRAIPAVGLAGVRNSPALGTVTAYRRELETYSSPLLYALFGAAASTRYDRDHLAFQAGSMAAFVAGFMLIARGLRLGTPVRLGLLAFVLEWNEPVFADAGVANVSRLQLGLIGVCFALTASSSPAGPAALGALLAAGTLFKPNLAFLPLWLGLLFVVRRRYRDLALALAGGAAAALLAGAWAARGGFPWGMWSRWMRAAAAMPEAIIPLHLGNLSIAHALWTGLGLDVAAPLGLALSILAVLAIRRRPPAPDDDHLVIALAALAPLLVARLVWIHYFVLALPALCVGFRASARPVAAWASVVALGLFAVRPIFTVLGRVDLLLEAVLMNAAALGLFAATLIDLALPPTAARASIDSGREATGGVVLPLADGKK